MDDFLTQFAVFGRSPDLGAPISEQSIRTIAEDALLDRGLAAAVEVDGDESTFRVTYVLEHHGRTLRRTTRFSADADPSLVRALVRKAAKRLERDVRGGPDVDDSPHRFWKH